MLDSNLDTPKADNAKEEVLRMVFHRSTKEAPEITLTYYTYDGNYDSVAVNGTERYLVKKCRCKRSGTTDSRSV